MADPSIYKRPSELLQHLIRFNTTNPPGNELARVQYLNDLLQVASIETTILAKDANRPNLIARLPGNGSAPHLLPHHGSREAAVRPQAHPARSWRAWLQPHPGWRDDQTGPHPHHAGQQTIAGAHHARSARHVQRHCCQRKLPHQSHFAPAHPLWPDSTARSTLRVE